ncbi:mediator of RNA polymerase II transcription subunit 1 isoform X2 [Melanotaenia boesemani]|nr:mediator of RNA polymerase II transcription subunit 1 isoform X2 [Melanotaenia boesemani]
MKEDSTLSNLHLKFAKKTWNDTFQLVQKCMEKSRDESKPCAPLVRSLERLQEVLHAPSINTTRSRLETIAKQQGMGFHTTEDTCYLTAALFYLEILLLPCGGVQEVKVAPHGESPVSSESLLQLLRSKNFTDFSMKLGGLFAQYSIPGDNEVKLKLLASLKYLGKDLQQISNIPREPKYSDPQVDLINNSRIGCLIAGKEDCPLTIQFYTPLTDGLKTSDPLFEETNSEPVVQAAQVTIGVSDVTHKLQMASVVPLPPQLDPHGCPMFAPLSQVPNEMLPACFLLKLQPAVPMMWSFVEKLRAITDVTIPEVDLQWAPLPKLLMRSLSANRHWKTLEDISVPVLSSVSYILPGAAWDVPAQRAAVVDSVPFSHPAHVAALLELLRHQCAINTLLSSCLTVQSASQGSICERHFEILPESDTSFSVTFHQPCTSSLAVLLVNISSPHQITCSFFGEGMSDPSLDEYITTVIKRCMSIPVTMRKLHRRLEEITSAPLSPSCPATAEAKNDRLTPSSTDATDTSRDSTTRSQTAAVPENHVDLSGSACCAMSVAQPEFPPEIKTTPP